MKIIFLYKKSWPKNINKRYYVYLSNRAYNLSILPQSQDKCCWNSLTKILMFWISDMSFVYICIIHICGSSYIYVNVKMSLPCFWVPQQQQAQDYYNIDSRIHAHKPTQYIVKRKSLPTHTHMPKYSQATICAMFPIIKSEYCEIYFTWIAESNGMHCTQVCCTAAPRVTTIYHLHTYIHAYIIGNGKAPSENAIAPR